jgi:hypothetical protein
MKNEQSENLKNFLLKQGQKTTQSNKKLSILEPCIDWNIVWPVEQLEEFYEWKVIKGM